MRCYAPRLPKLQPKRKGKMKEFGDKWWMMLKFTWEIELDAHNNFHNRWETIQRLD
ncbi:hypothetical protein QJS04_geneDACA021290 [Acorus gramineus]|uniref:Uncharacterized protein n=1 Tax=Acorus gramineus TaxID=55184 RepID=A0AAV9BUA7_ACOGR|nr:hypothetical protein QJS04_geneDACA021290 [Acorus gramineus]